MQCIEKESDKLRWKMNESERMLRLQQRQQIIASIRDDLYSQGFLEAETPLLVRGTCPDAEIESIIAGQGYLTTSTEYQIKRMIAGGFDKVFTLTKNFRGGDRGRYHSTEFTMLEWARANDTLHSIEEDVIRFVRKAFLKLNSVRQKLLFNGAEIDINKPWERLSVRSAFEIHLGIRNLKDFSLQSLLEGSRLAKIDIPDGFKEDKHLLISFLMDKLQGHLGKQVPTFLREWPAYLTTSAPVSLNDPTVAERSELFIAGIEISDGFPFLTDAVVQRKLFAEELERRVKAGKPRVVLDEKYLSMLDEGLLPAGAGMALGMDRLVMVLTGASRLSEVQTFDWDEL